MDKKALEDLTGKFCDNYCKFACEIKDPDELDEVCNKCPMNEMFELLD